MAPSSSPFAPWDGDRDQAFALASLLRRVGGTAGVHVYELEPTSDGGYRCRVWIGQAVESLLGGMPDGMDAETAWETCVHPDDRAAYDSTWRRMCAGEPTSLEYRMVGFDGTVRWLWERANPRPQDDGSLLIDGVVAEITERRMVEEQLAEARDRLQQLAYHDALTGLPNRLHFTDRLEERLHDARSDTRFAVLFVDLDGFKDVNDGHGHAVGDALLQEVGRRLRAAAPTQLAARLGGDEFLLLDDAPSPAGLTGRVSAALGQPYELGDSTFRLGCSVGVAVYPVDGTSSDDLIRAADAAMYHQKRTHRSRAA
jgi:diguanylate cyclase (GGDEF)-like protein/PAS domain S-box-containing protein